MLDPKQTKKFIANVLEQDLKPYCSHEAVHQLLFTCAVESDLGTYFEQINGPAKGFFQIEPKTEKLVWMWAFENHDMLFKAIVRNCTGDIFGGFDLKGNFRYQIIIARANYYSWPAALPIVSNPVDTASVKRMAEYWKMYWNTGKGKGVPEEAIEKYYSFVGLEI